MLYGEKQMCPPWTHTPMRLHPTNNQLNYICYYDKLISAVNVEYT